MSVLERDCGESGEGDNMTGEREKESDGERSGWKEEGWINV